jgi:ComF family protein
VPGLHHALATTLRAFVDILFPPCCAGCGAPLAAGILCPDCAPLVAPLRSPRCPRCGVPFDGAGPDHDCGRCILAPPPFASTSASFRYEGPVADGLRALKYGPRPERAEPLAEIWRQACGPLPEADLAVPVPLHPAKLRARGFNQAVLLARPLLRARRVPFAPLVLRRTAAARSQAGLPLAERRRAPRGLFALAPRAAPHVAGRCVLVVDDVMTTGATVAECARVLVAAGAAEVHALVLARTPRAG